VSFAASSAKSTSGWAQLSVTFPTNFTSNRINWTLRCPIPGSLGLTNAGLPDVSGAGSLLPGAGH
jgi:hypothetical protein